MSWIGRLYETYENCAALVNEPLPERVGDERAPVPLLPVAHALRKAAIEVTVTMDGNFADARAIENKADRMTVIPCREESAGRSGSAIAPHPLHEKLEYVAGDFAEFFEPKTKQSLRFETYLSNLQKWCDSEYGDERLRAVLKYLKKGTLVADLVDAGLFDPDESGKIPEKVPGKDKLPIYRAVDENVSDALVRFVVEDYDSDTCCELWRDETIRDKYIQWYLSTLPGADLCYATGRIIPCADNNPDDIRYRGDNAKLISGNDKSNFTFRGRFKTASQAARIGYETTQKAHNALRWLIDKQGYRNGDAVCLAWGTKGEELPAIGPSGSETIGDNRLEKLLREDYARNLRMSLSGWYADLREDAGVSIICVDSVTEGRLSITYYREMNGREYLDRIAFWYGTCVWPTKRRDATGVVHAVTEAPALEDILKAAYGEKANIHLKKAVFQQLLRCIADGARIPRNVINKLVVQATRPYDGDGWSVYEKNEFTKEKRFLKGKKPDPDRFLRVACAAIRKYVNDRYNPGVYTVDDYQEVIAVTASETLKNANSIQKQDWRSYQFGRMWAYYHHIESKILASLHIKGETNAIRLRWRFRMKPASTTGILEEKLVPYVRRRRWLVQKELNELNAIAVLLKGQDLRGDFNDESLNECFVLGYMSQLDELDRREEEEKAQKEQEKAKKDAAWHVSNSRNL